MHIVCNKKTYSARLSEKDDSSERPSDSQESSGDFLEIQIPIFQNDKQKQKKMPSEWLYMTGGDVSAILHFKDLKLNLAITCDCDRHFNSLQRLHIDRACEWKQSYFLIEECKSNVGVTNPDYSHNIHSPTAVHKRPNEIPSWSRINWHKGKQRAIWSHLDQTLSLILASHVLRVSRLNHSTVLCVLEWRRMNKNYARLSIKWRKHFFNWNTC